MFNKDIKINVAVIREETLEWTRGPIVDIQAVP